MFWTLIDLVSEINVYFFFFAGGGCAWRSLEQIQDLLDDPENVGNLGICYNIYLQGLAQ